MAEPDMPPNACEMDPHIRDEFLMPLIEATTVAFREVVKLEILFQSQWESNTPDLTEGRTVAVEQQYSHGQGRMYLNVPSSAVMEIAKRMLFDVTHDIDNRLADDCLGEVLNIVAGQGKAMLGQSQWHYSFGTPQFIAGPFLSSAPNTWFVVTFQSEFGSIRLVVKKVDNERN